MGSGNALLLGFPKHGGVHNSCLGTKGCGVTMKYHYKFKSPFLVRQTAVRQNTTVTNEMLGCEHLSY